MVRLCHVPDLSLQPYLFRSHKHPLLDLTFTFLSLLSSFLSANPVHHVDIFRSGLVFWAQLSWTHSLRNNNGSSSRTPLHSSYPKPVSYASSRSNTISFVATLGSGNPVYVLMANNPLSFKALSHVKIVTHSPLQPNLLSIMPLPSHTPTFSDVTPTTTPSVRNMPPLYPLPLHLRLRNKPASIASWQSFLIPALSHHLTHHEHPFPVLSGLVREAGPSGLVRGPVTGIQGTMSYSTAHPFLLRAAVSSASGPLTHMSLGPIKALCHSAISNGPVIDGGEVMGEVMGVTARRRRLRKQGRPQG